MTDLGGVLVARARRFAVLPGIVALLLAVLAPAASGQEATAPAALEVRLASIDAVLTGAPDEELRATLRIAAGPEARAQLRLVTTVHARAADEAELANSYADGPQEEVYSSAAQALPPMSVGTTALINVTIPAEDLALDSPDVAGVYPVEFAVFQQADPVGSLVTAAVLLPEDDPRPLPATMVVAVAGGSIPMGDAGVPLPSTLAMLAPDGPLPTLARELAAVAADGSAAGLVVELSGRALADAAQLVDGYLGPDGEPRDPRDRVARRADVALGRLADLLRRRDVESVALPYGPADVVALVRGGEADEAAQLVATGRTAVREVTGIPPAADIVVPPDGVDAATVAALGDTDPAALLLGQSYLAMSNPDAGEPVRRLRTADGGVVRILVPDRSLSAIVADPRGTGVAASVQHLRAATALRWMNGAGPATGVLLRVDDDDPAAGLLAAVNDMMGRAPWLRPVTLTRLSALVAPSSRVVRLAYPPRSRAAELDEDYVAALGEAREALVPLRALLPSADPSASGFGRSLLAAAALPYRDRDARALGRARIDDVLTTLGGLATAVEVVEGPPITLTSTVGVVPVIVLNRAATALRVRVRVASAGFEFDQATVELDLPAESAQTVTFSATARNPGALSGVGVAVEDPTGQVVLTTSTLAVRSTAFPVVGLIAVVGGGVVLMLWVVRESRRRRGAPAEPAEAEAADDRVSGSA